MRSGPKIICLLLSSLVTLNASAHPAAAAMGETEATLNFETVSMNVRDFGPGHENLKVIMMSVPEEQEAAFTGKLLQDQREALPSGKGNQLLILQGAEAAESNLIPADSESANTTVKTLTREQAANLTKKDRLPADSLTRLNRVGTYVAFYGWGATTALFEIFVTHDINGPLIAGSFLSAAFQVVMNKKPQLLWNFMNGGGELAKKLLRTKDASPFAQEASHEFGKAIAAVIFNIGLTTAFTVGLKYQHLFEIYPNIESFMKFVVPTAATSVLTKNVWDFVFTRWRKDTPEEEKMAREKVVKASNAVRMILLSTLLPMMYVPELRAFSVDTMLVLGVLGMPVALFKNHSRRFAERVVAGIERSSAFQAVSALELKATAAAEKIKATFLPVLPAPAASGFGLRCEGLHL